MKKDPSLALRMTVWRSGWQDRSLYKFCRLVPFQGLVVLVQLRMSVAWKIHAEPGEGVYAEFVHEFGRMSFVINTLVEC